MTLRIKNSKNVFQKSFVAMCIMKHNFTILKMNIQSPKPKYAVIMCVSLYMNIQHIYFFDLDTQNMRQNF